jgi:chromosome segregation ATPase
MKKAVKKIVKKASSKEDKFDMLARLVQNGFEQVDKRFEQIDKRFEQIDKRFEKIDQKIHRIDSHLERTDSQLFSINHELKEHTVRLDSIERKQEGIKLSVDETVHVSEFKKLSQRVEVLEKAARK